MTDKIWYFDNTWVYMNVAEFLKIKDSFECSNLKKIQAQNMGLWGWQKMPDIINHYERIGRDLVKVPMGILWKWGDRFGNRSTNKSREPSWYEELIVRETLSPDELDMELREMQLKLIEDLTSNIVWLWHCSTWVGKTYILSKIIEKFQTKTLIVCSGIELMNQMKKDIHDFFGVQPLTISGIKKKQKDSDDRIVIGNIDSLIKIPKEELDKFWLIILDETDRFFQSENRLKWVSTLCPQRMYGLTGTIKLNHVSDDIFKIYLWPKSELLLKNFTPSIYKVLTNFVYSEWELQDMKEFHVLKNELYFDDNRNSLIVKTISETLWQQKGIVFCEYIDHAKLIRDRLEEIWIKTFMLIGEVKSDDRKRIKQELKDYKWRCVLIGSVKIIGRWFNLPELSIGYLLTTEKFTSNIWQYIGRILRQFPWKEWCSFYDFTDTSPSILANQSKSRSTTYKREFPWCKITII